MAAEQLTPEAKKEAERKYQREYMRVWRKRHLERERARSRAWRDAHLEQERQRTRDWIARWREQNPDALRERSAKYYRANSAELKEKATKWKKENPDKVLQARRRPSTRMRRLIVQAGSRARKRGLEFDGLVELSHTVPTHCVCCGKAFDYSNRNPSLIPSLDRFDSSRGYTVDNVYVICFRCNSLKKDASLEEFENLVRYMSARPEKH